MSRKILFCNSQFRYYNDGTMAGDGIFRSKWTVKNGIVYYYSYVFDNWVQDTGEIQRIYTQYWIESITSDE